MKKVFKLLLGTLLVSANYYSYQQSGLEVTTLFFIISSVAIFDVISTFGTITLIRNKLERGEKIDQILRELDPFN